MNRHVASKLHNIGVVILLLVIEALLTLGNLSAREQAQSDNIFVVVFFLTVI